MNESVATPWGAIAGATCIERDDAGRVVSCTPSAESVLETPYGRLVPQFTTDDTRRTRPLPVLFHPDGSVKSLPLEVQTVVPTPAGRVPAELLTFHPGGALKRVFPTNGKLSGFWGLAEEFALAPVVSFDSPLGRLEMKVVNLTFHPGGAFHSLTLWPGDTLDVVTPAGPVTTRVGVSFHEDGTVSSVEPVRPVVVATPIGKLPALDPDPVGLSGDANSLAFAPDGSVSALATVGCEIVVTCPGAAPRLFAPVRTVNLCEDDGTPGVQGLRLSFSGGCVRVNAAPESTFDLTACAVTIRPLPLDLPVMTLPCA